MPTCGAFDSCRRATRTNALARRPAINTMKHQWARRLTGAESTQHRSRTNDTPRAKTPCKGKRSHLGVVVRVASKQGHDVARQYVPFR
jgi:hypothetical protein